MDAVPGNIGKRDDRMVDVSADIDFSRRGIVLFFVALPHNHLTLGENAQVVVAVFVRDDGLPRFQFEFLAEHAAYQTGFAIGDADIVIPHVINQLIEFGGHPV